MCWQTDPVPDLGRRGVGGSWRSNRKRGAVGSCAAEQLWGLWALQAVPEVWLSAQTSAREAAVYLTRTWGITAFSSVNELCVNPWKVKIQYRGSDCQDLFYPCSVSVWIPFAEGFSFLTDYLSLGFMCCSQNSDVLCQPNGCLTSYPSCCSWIFSKLFKCLRR